MSNFTVGATSVDFLAVPEGFQEQYPTLLRTWDFDALLDLPTDYTSLVTLLSYPVAVRTCPSGVGTTTMDVDIGGGAGAGTLTLDDVVGSPFTAALVRIGRGSAYPGGGRIVHVSFQEMP